MKPLAGLLVLEFCQYMSGPSAALRLADLGARVIKIERPSTGEPGRQLAINKLFSDGDSLVWHTINRNKESFAVDLKSSEERKTLNKLIQRADVMLHNFRPGVMEKLGLDYDAIKVINDRLIYGEITGYGSEGPWKNKPGQDLLLQSISGITQLSGNAGDGPVPFGLAIVDMLCGAHMAQGILAALVRRGITNQGGLVEVSMLESALDFQFEVLTTHFNDGGQLPQRSAKNNAHAYLGAPYGIYQTQNGYLALAMGQIPVLGKLLNCEPLLAYTHPDSWFDERDTIKAILADHLAPQTTEHWLSILEPADIWCADVLDYQQLVEHPGYQVVKMEQTVTRTGGNSIKTTRCPIRIDGEILFSAKPAPRVGEHNEPIFEELTHA